jgi:CO/xanthine dehydrogenase FAD-binding subunit
MLLPDLSYVRARTVEEALALRFEKPDARFVAGGTDLLPQARCGTCSPPLRTLIDIKTIPELAKIRQNRDGSLSIGAAASVAAVAGHQEVRRHYPVLVDCCLSLGSYPLRNRATVAGNICNASPCADTSAALLALDARVAAVGPQGRREIEIGDFFQGPGQTSLRAGELVVEVILPKKSQGGRGHYGRIARRRAVDISTVAVLVTWISGLEPEHRVSLLSVAPTPLRVPEAEKLLDREGPDGATRAAELCMSACSPIDDVRASAEYRRAMVGVLTERGARAVAAGTGR